MKIKFVRTELYENEGRNKGHLFKEGEVYDLPEDQANRWLRRGAAERMEPPEGFTPIAQPARKAGEAEPSGKSPQAAQHGVQQAPTAQPPKDTSSQHPASPVAGPRPGAEGGAATEKSDQQKR